MNMPSIVRAGRLLGRCHAALGQHTLAVAALEAAIGGAKIGELVFSEALTVRTRALVSKAAGATVNVNADGGSNGGGAYWSEAEGKRRLQEMMGRMDCERPLLEKLMLHGL